MFLSVSFYQTLKKTLLQRLKGFCYCVFEYAKAVQYCDWHWDKENYLSELSPQ